MKRTGITSLIIISLLIGCSDFEPFEGEKITQFASSVIDFSSQYHISNWHAIKSIGEPDLYPTYGDLPGAWASATPDNQREFLVLGFTEPQTVKKIEIYETYSPGAIDTIYLLDVNSEKWKIVYAKPAQTGLPAEARIFTIHLIETQYMANAIRLAINSPAVASWNEIDAVAITGQK
ncbi:MAG: hypothetical protein J0L67_15320 [Cytophagales bacterium]|nr:hypothetical protein [Cytophagales bacterium]